MVKEYIPRYRTRFLYMDEIKSVTENILSLELHQTVPKYRNIFRFLVLLTKNPILSLECSVQFWVPKCHSEFRIGRVKGEM